MDLDEMAHLAERTSAALDTFIALVNECLSAGMDVDLPEIVPVFGVMGTSRGGTIEQFEARDFNVCVPLLGANGKGRFSNG